MDHEMKRIPATSLQQQMYVEHHVQPDGSISNLPIAFSIKGALSVSCLTDALTNVCERHEILRTRFIYENKTLFQDILPDSQSRLEVHDIPASDVSASLTDIIREKIDLHTAPPLRFILYRTGEESSVFLAIFHHILADFHSLSTFCSELGALYNTASVGETNTLPEITFQSSDFAKWEKSWIDGSNASHMLDYWERVWKERQSNVALAGDIQSDDPVYQGQDLVLEYDKSYLTRLQDFCKSQSLNEFVALCSAYLMVLYRFSASPSAVLGIPLTNRRHVSDDHTMGCFANMLPIRFNLDGVATVGELLREVRSQLLLAHRNQESSLNRIVSRINPAREAHRNPLYQVGFTLRKPYPYALDLKGCETEFNEQASNSSTLDVYCMAGIDNDGIRIRFEYNASLYSPAWIARFSERFNESLELVLSGPDRQLPKPDVLDAPSTVSVVSSKTSIAQMKAQNGHNVVVVSSFTGDLIVKPLEFWMHTLGIPLNNSSVVNYQVIQQLLNVSSELNNNTGGTSIILLRVEDWLHADDHAGYGAVWDRNVLQNEAETFVRAMQSAAKVNRSQLILCLCHPSQEIMNDPGKHGDVLAVHKAIASACGEIGGIALILPEDIESFYTLSDIYDPVSFRKAMIPYQTHYYTALATMVARKVNQHRFPPYKVVAVDADNTLWAGVVGEDGPKNLLITPAHRALQMKLLELHGQGVLLCLASKNNIQDIADAFDSLPDMPLTLDHFVAKRINWQPKSQNVRAIAGELDLGLDSFIFIDDNPVECGEMRTNCPEVLTVQFHADSGGVERILKHLWAFDRGEVTTEDRARSRQYAENVSRKTLRRETGSFSQFIKELDLNIVIHSATTDDYPRVSQMTYRINQFRTTAGNMAEQEVRALLDDGDNEVWIVHVTDKYGDYGIVGLLQLHRSDSILHIERMLLSCRALGKGVEYEMLAFAGKKALENGLSNCAIRFETLERNRPALEFLEHVAGEHVTTDNDNTQYILPASETAAICFDPSAFEMVDDDTQDIRSTGTSINREMAVLRNGRMIEIVDSLYSIERIQTEIIGSESPGTMQDVVHNNTHTNQSLVEIMTDIWVSVLSRNHVSTNESFFDLGGDSILIPQVISMFHERTGHSLEILDMFKYPTIDTLVANISQEESEAVKPLTSSAQDRASKRAMMLSKRRQVFLDRKGAK